MTRLEQIDFENEEKLMEAIKKLIKGEEAFRSYEKDGETVSKRVISKNKLWMGNFAIGLNKADNGKCYLSVNYYAFDDRMAMHAKAKEKTNNNI